MHHRKCSLAETPHPKRSTENKAHGQKILIHAQQTKCQSFFSPRERGQRCDFQLADTTYGTNSLGWEVATGCNRCLEVVALASMRMKLFASFLHLHTPLVPKTINIFFGIIGVDTLNPCSLEPPALGSGYTVYVLSMARCPLVSDDFFFQTTHLGRFTSADCFVPASARPNKFIASFPLNLFNAWNAHMKMYVQKTRLLSWSQRQKYYWHLCAYFAGLFGSRWILRTLVWKLLDLKKRGPTLRK